MSDLSKLTGAARADVLPGYELSPFTLGMYGQVEEELERRHLRTAGNSSIGLPDDVRKQMLEVADDDVLSGRFGYGRPAFDSRARSTATLPFLLWVCLKRKHATITMPDCEKLITAENEHDVYWAVMGCMGYRKIPIGETPPKKSEASADPNGGKSSASPPSSDSTPPTSPA